MTTSPSGILSGVLREVVAGHMRAAVACSVDLPKIGSQFKWSIKSFRQLIELVEKKDADGAEKFWRTHMESAAKKVLWGTLANECVVDLFDGWSPQVSCPTG